MADALRPRLDRLQNLTKSLNASADSITAVVQGVETHLNDVCHLGIHASVLLDSASNDEGYFKGTYLVYGRCGAKFRIFIVESETFHGEPEQEQTTLWANCSRDLKLMAYRQIPNLLDKLTQQVEDLLEDVKSNTEMIQAIIPAKGKKKEATS